jgi:hypothetical protein
MGIMRPLEKVSANSGCSLAPDTACISASMAIQSGLLCGGDKDSQQRDIQQAQAYWLEYRQYANL